MSYINHSEQSQISNEAKIFAEKLPVEDLKFLCKNGFILLDSFDDLRSQNRSINLSLDKLIKDTNERIARDYKDFPDMIKNTQRVLNIEELSSYPDIVNFAASAQEQLEKFTESSKVNKYILFSNYIDQYRLYAHRDGGNNNFNPEVTHRFILVLRGTGTIFVPSEYDPISRKESNKFSNLQYETEALISAREAGSLFVTPEYGASVHRLNNPLNRESPFGPIHSSNLGDRLILVFDFKLG